jgi:hypothetical protein
LQRRDAACLKLDAQHRRERFRANQRLLERADITALGGRAVEQDLEKRGGADIGDRPQISDRLQLLVGLTGSGRDAGQPSAAGALGIARPRVRW